MKKTISALKPVFKLKCASLLKHASLLKCASLPGRILTSIFKRILAAKYAFTLKHTTVKSIQLQKSALLLKRTAILSGILILILTTILAHADTLNLIPNIKSVNFSFEAGKLTLDIDDIEYANQISNITVDAVASATKKVVDNKLQIGCLAMMDSSYQLPKNLKVTASGYRNETLKVPSVSRKGAGLSPASLKSIEINYNAGSITIETAFDESYYSAITSISVNEAVISEATYNEGIITILQNYEKNIQYNVKINADGYQTQKATFEAIDMPDYFTNIKSFSMGENDNINISAEFGNHTSSKKDGIVICGVYDGIRLIDMQYKPASAEPKTSETVDFNLSFDENYQIKLFSWNNFNDMYSISETNIQEYPKLPVITLYEEAINGRDIIFNMDSDNGFWKSMMKNVYNSRSYDYSIFPGSVDLSEQGKIIIKSGAFTQTGSTKIKFTAEGYDDIIIPFNLVNEKQTLEHSFKANGDLHITHPSYSYLNDYFGSIDEIFVDNISTSYIKENTKTIIIPAAALTTGSTQMISIKSPKYQANVFSVSVPFPDARLPKLILENEVALGEVIVLLMETDKPEWRANITKAIYTSSYDYNLTNVDFSMEGKIIIPASNFTTARAYKLTFGSAGCEDIIFNLTILKEAPSGIIANFQTNGDLQILANNYSYKSAVNSVKINGALTTNYQVTSSSPYKIIVSANEFTGGEDYTVLVSATDYKTQTFSVTAPIPPEIDDRLPQLSVENGFGVYQGSAVLLLDADNAYWRSKITKISRSTTNITDYCNLAEAGKITISNGAILYTGNNTINIEADGFTTLTITVPVLKAAPTVSAYVFQPNGDLKLTHSDYMYNSSVSAVTIDGNNAAFTKSGSYNIMIPSNQFEHGTLQTVKIISSDYQEIVLSVTAPIPPDVDMTLPAVTAEGNIVAGSVNTLLLDTDNPYWRSMVTKVLRGSSDITSHCDFTQAGKVILNTSAISTDGNYTLKISAGGFTDLTINITALKTPSRLYDFKFEADRAVFDFFTSSYVTAVTEVFVNDTKIEDYTKSSYYVYIPRTNFTSGEEYTIKMKATGYGDYLYSFTAE